LPPILDLSKLDIKALVANALPAALTYTLISSTGSSNSGLIL
jgi:hypothetical protein